MRTWCTLLALLVVALSLIECRPNRGIGLGFGKRSDEEGLAFRPLKRAPTKFNLGFGKRAAEKPKFSMGFGKRSPIYEDDDESEQADDFADYYLDDSHSLGKRSLVGGGSLKGLQKFNLGLGK